MRLPNPHKEEELNRGVALMTLRVAAEGMLPALCPFECSQDSHSERRQAVSSAKSWEETDLCQWWG